jgi:Domain of unknown function (DUF4136)
LSFDFGAYNLTVAPYEVSSERALTRKADFKGRNVKKLLAILLLVVGASSTNAQKVQIGADPNIDLSKYKTYAWTKGMGGPNPIIHQLIVDAVDRALTSKGLTKVETEPEITVAIWAATESDLHITYPSWSPSLNSISTGIVGGTQTWPVTKGTLVVELSDTRTTNSVWRGTATDTLKHGPTGNAAKDAKSVEKPIKKAVEKMFKRYPHPKQH